MSPLESFWLRERQTQFWSPVSESGPTQQRERRVPTEAPGDASGLPAPLRLVCTAGSGLPCLVLALALALDLLMHFICFGTCANCFNLVSDLPPTTVLTKS